MNTQVLIVGAGLSGLLTAYRLSSRGMDVQLVDARARVGGRIAGLPIVPAGVDTAVDMGPSWFWPGQSAITRLVEEMNLQSAVYEQFSDGLSVVEYADGQIQQRHGAASMAGSLRIDGGIYRLVDALVSRLDTDRIHTGRAVTKVRQHDDGKTATVFTRHSAHTITCQSIVLALPPRMVASGIVFEPALSSSHQQVLEQTPTWMAAQAKLVVIYSDAFWRQAGLSGDAFSQRGPLTEIHDASPDSHRQAALFGFVGVSPARRRDQQQAIEQAALDQLQRLFGKHAGAPLHLHYKDWAQDEYTCTSFDVHNSCVPASEFDLTGWDSRIVWAGSETARRSTHANGYLEGAVEAANRASEQLVKLLA